MALSMTTFSQDLQNKETELDFYLSYTGDPEKFESDFKAFLKNFTELLGEDLEIERMSFVTAALKAEAGTLGHFTTHARALTARINAMMTHITSLCGSRFELASLNANSERVLTALASWLNACQNQQVALLAQLPPLPSMSVKAQGKQKAATASASDSGEETERPFIEIVKKRMKKKTNVARPISERTTMPLKEFHAITPVEDGTPFNDKDSTWGFNRRIRNTIYYRTFATYGKYLKGTNVLVPPKQYQNYPAKDMEKREIHPATYIPFASCPLSVLKAALSAGYFPEDVYREVLSKGLFDDSENAMPTAHTFEEVEKQVRGAGDIADILFWQGRAEKLFIEYGYEAKIPFLRKWFPRFADVPDVLLCGSGEAARRMYEWLARDMRKKPEERNPNGTFNGLLQGMLAKWPRGWDRDKMIERYMPSVKALWGADLAPVFVAEFKKTELGQQLTRPRQASAMGRLLAHAKVLKEEATRVVVEGASTSKVKLEEAKERAGTLLDRAARLEKTATWREQMLLWRGRFTRSLPDFTRAMPKPLRAIVDSTGVSRAAPEGKWSRTKTFLAVTVGFPFMRQTTKISSTEGVTVESNDVEARPWFRSVLDYVFNITEDEQGVRVYEPLPGALGTMVAWGETAKYIAWDLPSAAVYRFGHAFNNYGGEPSVAWPKLPRVGTAVLGTAFATIVGLTSAVLFAPTFAAAQVALTVGGTASLMFRDAISWLRGTEWDDNTAMWYHRYLPSRETAATGNEVVFEVLPTDIEDVTEIVIADNRPASVASSEDDEVEGLSSPPG